MITYTVDGSSVTTGLRFAIEALDYRIAKQHGQIPGTVFHKCSMFFPQALIVSTFTMTWSLHDDLVMFNSLTRDKNDCDKQDSGPK